ncbi:TPA: hypothetical protein PIV86_005447 [Klebsiella quasipneumoniae subsp. similipneumoniae]|nr:hypothetical protein [Klebsiella quasipneumoniae subsp. similipneumoniae]
MTTDITELAQRLKAAAEKWQEAWAKYDKVEITIAEFIRAAEQYESIVKDTANIIALVEALEKAQETIAFQQGEIKALLSSLESRTVTVKLPDEVDVLLNHLEDVLPFEVFQLIDARKWNAVSRLSASGIKVEAE